MSSLSQLFLSVLSGNPEMSPTTGSHYADLLEQTMDKVLENFKFISETDDLIQYNIFTNVN